MKQKLFTGEGAFKQVKLLLLLGFLTSVTCAQNLQPISLNINDPAPPLRVHEWIKGTPVKKFEKGQIYVLEFWATWCKPCIASMPHLCSLAHEYKNKVAVLAIDVYEKQIKHPKSSREIKAFVDSLGEGMDFSVATEDSEFTAADWIEAAGEDGIPKTFVVNAEGKIAWIGHPAHLNQILPNIVDNSWDIQQALVRRNSNRYLAELDYSLRFELMKYDRDQFKPGSYDKPDSTLLLINQIVSNESRLKYAPFIAFKTFTCLLQTNLHEAYEYGKVAMITPTYEDAAYDAIIDGIGTYADKLNLPAEIYQLGIEAYKLKSIKLPIRKPLICPGIITKWLSGIGAQTKNQKQ